MKGVRLSGVYLTTIRKCFRKYFGKDDRLWIFGSRIDMSQKGGDIAAILTLHPEEALLVILIYNIEEKGVWTVWSDL